MPQSQWTPGPAPVEAWTPGPAPAAARHAFTAEEFIPPSTVPPQTLGRVASSAWDAIKSGTMGAVTLSGIPGMLREGPVGAVKDQADVVKGVLQSHYDQYRKAKEDEKAGRWLSMVGHSVAAAVPGVGPWINDVSEQAGSGDVTGAAGNVIGNAALAAAPMSMKGAKAVFGSDADKWPQDWLCKKHHDEWHRMMTAYFTRSES